MRRMKRGWDGMEAYCAVLATEDRGGGGALMNSERGKSANVAYPKLGCPKWVVDKVCEVVAELWARFGGLWWDVTRVQPWQAHSGTAHRRRPRGEKRGNGNDENQTGIPIYASTTCTSDAVVAYARVRAATRCSAPDRGRPQPCSKVLNGSQKWWLTVPFWAPISPNLVRVSGRC
jgi:hypothetical protein